VADPPHRHLLVTLKEVVLLRLTAPLATVSLVLVLVLGPLTAVGRAGAVAPADAGGAGPAEILVKPASGAGLLGSVSVGALPGVRQVRHVIEPLGVHVAAVAPGTAEEVAATLDALPVVEYAEPNVDFQLLDKPNDPQLAGQHALEHIDAVAGWTRYRQERGLAGFPAAGGATIAVIDSGIDELLHPEFADKIGECRSWLTGLRVGLDVCQDNNVHGTHVTGIAAAIADNGVGVAGVGFDAEVMSLQACTLTCALADVADALVYAAENGADVVNMSFGGPHSDTLAEAVRHVADAGVVQVAASGNDGGPVNFPAAYPEVMAVSATDQNDEFAGFSSQGPEIDVAAPGVRVISSVPTGLVYAGLSGTSQSAPHVAGLAGLLIALAPDATATEIRAAITAGADRLPGASSEEQGAGRINVAESIEALLGP
jgi:subtilisin family serine protease